MGSACGASRSSAALPGVTASSEAHAVAEAEEAALARLREENAELARANKELERAVADLSARLNALAAEVSSLKVEAAEASTTATRALQAAQSAAERADAAQLAAAAAAQARPPTAPGPIPMPAAAGDGRSDQRLSQLEASVAALGERLDGVRAREEFTRQLRAAQGEGVPVPQLGRSGSIASSTGAQSVTSPEPPMDGSTLLPAGNNFPSRLGGGGSGGSGGGGPGGGGGGGALRPARERVPGRPVPGASGSGSGPDEWATPAFGPGGGPGGGGPGGGGGDLMSTHRYGNVLPSDFKLAEQRRQGPKQFL